MAGSEGTIDACIESVEDASGNCRLNKHTYTNCAVGYAKDCDGHVTLDQDENIKQLRLIQHRELTRADAEVKAAEMVAD
eukprot:649108-Pyramimonas_sp.AAC.1